MRGVPEAVALQVIVSNLADALGPERLPAQVLAAVPAARRAGHALVRIVCPAPLLPWMIVEGPFAQRRELLHELLAACHGEGRGDADVMERPLVVVEAEEKRPDHRPGTVLVPAEPGDHAVGGARVLDLHHLALAGEVVALEALGDDAVEARAFETREPVAGDGELTRRWREVDGRLRLRQRALELLAPFGERMVEEILVAEGEEVEGDVGGGSLRGEQLHPRGSRMDAQQERLELQAGGSGDDDLAVEDAALRDLAGERLDQLREVPVERLQLAALQIDLALVAENEAAKPIPLRLVEKAVAGRKVLGELGEHGLDGRSD